MMVMVSHGERLQVVEQFGADVGDHTLRVVATGSAILGATSGALGSFAVLRRQSLLGDATMTGTINPQQQVFALKPGGLDEFDTSGKFYRRWYFLDYRDKPLEGLLDVLAGQGLKQVEFHQVRGINIYILERRGD